MSAALEQVVAGQAPRGLLGCRPPGQHPLAHVPAVEPVDRRRGRSHAGHRHEDPRGPSHAQRLPRGHANAVERPPLLDASVSVTERCALGLDDLRECGPIMRDTYFALTEQASEDTRPAHLMLVHSDCAGRFGPRRSLCLEAAARADPRVAEDQHNEIHAHDDVHQPAVGVRPVAQLRHRMDRAPVEDQVPGQRQCGDPRRSPRECGRFAGSFGAWPTIREPKFIRSLRDFTRVLARGGARVANLRRLSRPEDPTGEGGRSDSSRATPATDSSARLRTPAVQEDSSPALLVLVQSDPQLQA